MVKQGMKVALKSGLCSMLALAAFFGRACDARSGSTRAVLADTSSVVASDVDSHSLQGCGRVSNVIAGSMKSDAGVQLSLTMADFTGDKNPDTAVIELAQASPSSAKYFVEVELTEGGRQLLSVTAPPGGLFITPRDMTGDGTLDLVIRASGSGAILAVFLNDGCGGFVRADPSSVRRATDSAFSATEFVRNHLYHTAAAGSISSQQFDRAEVSCRLLPTNRNPLSQSELVGSTQRIAGFGAGRAPPRA
jgi:hypothetical protein